MAEELQHLLERIQTETVQKAEKEAAEILQQAKAKAAEIIKEGETAAQKSLEQADQDAQAYVLRSQKALEQAGRDLLITVGSGVEELFTKLVKESVSETMTPEVLAELLQSICANTDVKIVLGEKDQKKVTELFKGKFAEAVKEGDVIISTDNEIIAGFTVSAKGEDVYTDFTNEAIAEALMKFLRPELATIVQEVVQQK